jgi:hypothetical protein
MHLRADTAFIVAQGIRLVTLTYAGNSDRPYASVEVKINREIDGASGAPTN